MTLTPHEILKMLGFDIPEDGVCINPHDAMFHQQMLGLLGTTISPQLITEEEFLKVTEPVAHDPERLSKRSMYNMVLKELYHFKAAN